MASDRSQSFEISAPLRSGIRWRDGAIGGFVGTVVTGILITLADLSVMRGAIAGLYTFEGSLAAGWIAHLAHGTLFGVLFAAIMSDPILYRVSEWTWKAVLAGVAYGLVLAIAGAGIIMPIWLSAVGFASPPPIPNVSIPIVLWHVAYGAVLGGVFTALDSRDPSQHEPEKESGSSM